MQREQKDRPGKTLMRKVTRDDVEKQSENIGDSSREDFNLQTDSRDITLGRVAARDAPASVQGTISWNKKLARKFSEHVAKPSEIQELGYTKENVVPMTQSSGSTSDVSHINSDSQPVVKENEEHSLKQDDADSPIAEYKPQTDTALRNEKQSGLPVGDRKETQFKHSSANRRQIEQFNADKPDSLLNADTPIAESNTNTKLIFDQAHIQDSLTEGKTSPKDIPLLHDRIPHSVIERSGRSVQVCEQEIRPLSKTRLPTMQPGRLHFGDSASTQNKVPRNKSGSPDSAKYIPPSPPSEVKVASRDSPNTKQHQTDALPDVAAPKQPVTVQKEDAVFTSGMLRHKTESADKSETTETVFLKDGGSSNEKPLSKLISPDSPKHKLTDTAKTDKIETPKPASPVSPEHKPTDTVKTEKNETPKPDDAVPVMTADDELPVAETEKPSTEQDADKGKKPEADQGSTRSHYGKPGKLKFNADETTPTSGTAPSDEKPPGKKLRKAQYKAEQSGRKLDKAKKRLPKKHSIKIDKGFDAKSGKVKKKLRFEEEVKSQHEHIKGPLVTRPVKAGANAVIVNAHRKIYQVEHENVGTQAAHRGEMFAEGGLRTAYHMHKTAPYRHVEKLEHRTAKLNIKATYQKTLHDNPKLNSSMFSRMAQKRKIKKDYAKASRNAKKAANNVKKTSDVIGKVGQAAVRLASSHPTVFGIIGGLFLLVIIISSLFTSCSNMASGIGSAIVATSYVAADADVDDAELYYTEWETDLQMQIGRTESDFPGYDEYRYQVDDIGHNPYELMAYLTVMYQDFNYPDIEAQLRQIFDEQYRLTFTPSVETRYADPTDADNDGDYEPYDWHIMTVTLTSRSFTDVISSRMTPDRLQHYNILMMTKGGRQYAGSPFDFNWIPYVTSYYGYRIHPITGAADYHLGIDIGVPIGTDIHAASSGTVTTGYDAGGYGYYVVITDANGLVTKYAHCDSLLVSNDQTVTAGDIIAKSGNSGNSTGSHLHFEVIKNGRYINPIYFSKTNDSGGGPVYGYAGEPMGDGSYAAMIAEAEKYLGYPYVWGGASPSTSFDCSGYVSWVINQSGVGSVGRQTAQGLYNLCSPVNLADAQPGDLIFFTGTYSSANPVTHVGIYVGGGQMLHCGNPIQYTSINTSYWQSHFYAIGRIN